MRVYLVGGAVRDRLLGRAVRERDWVVVGATPEEMLAEGFRRKDPDFPVFLHPETGEEYALARRERKSDAGHKGFVVDSGTDVTLEEDLARRDLTVNAMAEALDHDIIDPFDGREAIRARRLRHVTDAFVEDPLRVLRLARFHAELAEHGFAVDDDTLALARSMCRGPDLRTLSAGRVWRETERALASASPAVFFQTLREVGAADVLLPWPVDAFDDALAALERAARAGHDIAVRLAALCAAGGAPPPERWPLTSAVRGLCDLSLAHPPPPLAEADAPRIVDWFQAADAWRRRERFDSAIRVWRAVAPARARDLERLLMARDASARIPPPPAGADPRAAARHSREALVRAALDETRAPSEPER